MKNREKNISPTLNPQIEQIDSITRTHYATLENNFLSCLKEENIFEISNDHKIQNFQIRFSVTFLLQRNNKYHNFTL